MSSSFICFLEPSGYEPGSATSQPSPTDTLPHPYNTTPSPPAHHSHTSASHRQQHTASEPGPAQPQVDTRREQVERIPSGCARHQQAAVERRGAAPAGTHAGDTQSRAQTPIQRTHTLACAHTHRETKTKTTQADARASSERAPPPFSASFSPSLPLSFPFSRPPLPPRPPTPSLSNLDMQVNTWGGWRARIGARRDDSCEGKEERRERRWEGAVQVERCRCRDKGREMKKAAHQPWQRKPSWNTCRGTKPLSAVGSASSA